MSLAKYGPDATCTPWLSRPSQATACTPGSGTLFKRPHQSAKGIEDLEPHVARPRELVPMVVPR